MENWSKHGIRDKNKKRTRKQRRESEYFGFQSKISPLQLFAPLSVRKFCGPWRNISAVYQEPEHEMETRAFCGRSGERCFTSLPSLFLDARESPPFFARTVFHFAKVRFQRSLRNDGLCTGVQGVEWQGENKVAAAGEVQQTTHRDATRRYTTRHAMHHQNAFRACNFVSCVMPTSRVSIVGRTAERRHADIEIVVWLVTRLVIGIP